MKIWASQIELSLHSFEAILDAACRLQRIDRVLFVVPLKKYGKKWQPYNKAILRYLDRRLRRYAVDMFLASAWPGSELTKHCGMVIILEYCDHLRSILLETEERLSDWTRYNKPPLPEDLCFFTNGASYPAFMSCTHEGEGWLLSSQESHMLHARPVQVDLREMFVFEGRYYCKAQRNQGIPIAFRSLVKNRTQLR